MVIPSRCCCTPPTVGACQHCDPTEENLSKAINDYDWSLELSGDQGANNQSAFDRCKELQDPPWTPAYEGDTSDPCNEYLQFVCDPCELDPFCGDPWYYNVHEVPDCSAYQTTISLGTWGSTFMVPAGDYRYPRCRNLSGLPYPTYNPPNPTPDDAGLGEVIFTAANVCSASFGIHASWINEYDLVQYTSCSNLTGYISFHICANNDVWLTVQMSNGDPPYSSGVFGQGYKKLDKKAGKILCDGFDETLDVSVITCDYCIRGTYPDEHWEDCLYCCKYCGVSTQVRLTGVLP